LTLAAAGELASMLRTASAAASAAADFMEEDEH
jgi:hypothetical protein